MKSESASTIGVILVLVVLGYGIWAYQNSPLVVAPGSVAQPPVTQIPLTPVTITPNPTQTPPVVIPQPQSGSVTVSVGSSATVGGVTITPIDVLEDSRCPLDVTCIQAGTVRMRAAVTTSSGTAIYEFKLGNMLTTPTATLQLEGVSPESRSTVPKNTADYRFTFQIVSR